MKLRRKSVEDDNEEERIRRNDKGKDTPLLQKAIFLRERGKFEAALEVLNQMLTEGSRSGEALVNKAFCLRALDKIEESLKVITQSLAMDPESAESHTFLGHHCREDMKLAEAIVHYKKAIELDPSNKELKESVALCLSDFGTQVKHAGDWVSGFQLYKEALSFHEESAPVHFNLGVAFAEKGALDEALKEYDLALKYKPQYPEALCNAGVIFKQKGEIVTALKYYEQAVKYNSKLPFILKNLAITLTDLGTRAKNTGEQKKAVRLYKKALFYNPKDDNTLYNLGVAYSEMGKSERSHYTYRLCVERNPKHSMALNNLGVLEKNGGNIHQAIEYYKQALEASPNFAQTLNNIGVIYTMIGQLDLGMVYLKKALEVDPVYVEVYNNLGILYRDECEITKSLQCYNTSISLDPQTRNAGHNKLLCINYLPKFDPEFVKNAHDEWDASFRPQYTPYTDWGHLEPLGPPTPQRRLNIGYISPDYFTHSVSYFIEAPLTYHDAERFQIFCYSNVERRDKKTERLKRLNVHWRRVRGMNATEVGDLIRKDQVDILVDLTGHTSSNRLDVLAKKPAPVQVTWIGYPNTTGLKTIDYRFVDVHTDPPEQKQYFSETLIRLPNCFLCYSPSTDAGPVVALPCHTNGFITFGSFNNLAKITHHVCEVWAEIMHRVPNSRLFIKAKPFVTERVQQKYFDIFHNLGIESWRVDLVGLLPATADHLEAYRFMDFSLDPFPYAGTTTTCEALYMGVPVISLTGNCHAFNVGASLLRQLEGHSQYIASTEKEYIDIAVELANNVPRLKEIRETLRPTMQKSYLCDGQSFTRNLEGVYSDIWETYMKSRGPLNTTGDNGDDSEKTMSD